MEMKFATSRRFVCGGISPSLLSIISQSTPSPPLVCERSRGHLLVANSFTRFDRKSCSEVAKKSGFDAGKKIKGRKRHILVDTMGLLIAVVVHSAAIQDRNGAKLVFHPAQPQSRLELIWADGGYAGQLIAWTKKNMAGA